MARRGAGGEGGGMAAPLIGVAVSLLTFIILIIFAPVIAGTIQNASGDVTGKEYCNVASGALAGTAYGQCGDSGVARNITTHSEWNGTDNTDLPSGVSIWTTVIQIIGVVFLVIAISIAIFYLKGM